jgi:hypothetical protein
MCATLVKCEHCKGTKSCKASGGRSCKVCLRAAGMGQGQWATVRCAICGGRGFVLTHDEEAAAEQAAASPETLAEAARAAEAAEAATAEPASAESAAPADAPAPEAPAE